MAKVPFVTGLYVVKELEESECELTFSNSLIIDHLHYDVIRAKPDGSCSRPAETGTSFPGGKPSG